MAKRVPKKNKFSVDRFFPLINVLCIVFAVANFVVIFLFERSRSPRIERIYETITTNHVIIVTNYIESASAISPSISSDPVSATASLSAREILVEYRYFMIGNNRYIDYCGRNFGEGSPTSYGRIKTIYPDRVELENDLWLKNSAFGKPKEVSL